MSRKPRLTDERISELKHVASAALTLASILAKHYPHSQDVHMAVRGLTGCSAELDAKEASFDQPTEGGKEQG